VGVCGGLTGAGGAAETVALGGDKEEGDVGDGLALATGDNSLIEREDVGGHL